MSQNETCYTILHVDLPSKIHQAALKMQHEDVHNLHKCKYHVWNT